MVEIVYYDKVFAGRTSDGIILLNPKLKDYPQLCGRIINHELAHTGGLTVEDTVHDILDTTLLSKDTVRLFLKYPKLVYYLLMPYTRYNGKTYVSISYLTALILMALWLLVSYFVVARL